MTNWKACCLAVVGFMLLSAQDDGLKKVGAFCPCGESAPQDWEFDDCRFYAPHPRLYYLPCVDCNPIMYVKDIQGGRGFNLCYSKRFKAKERDSVRVCVQVRGRGVCWFSVQSYHGDECLGVVSRKKIPLLDVWQTVHITLTVKDGAMVPATDNCMFALGAEQGSEMFLMDLKASVEACCDHQGERKVASL